MNTRAGACEGVYIFELFSNTYAYSPVLLPMMCGVWSQGSDKANISCQGIQPKQAEKHRVR